MNCSKCGFALENGQKFCPNCGNQIEKPKDPNRYKKIGLIALAVIACCVCMVCMTVIPSKPAASPEVVEIAVNSLDYIDSYLDERIGYTIVSNELSDDLDKIDAIMEQSDENHMANLTVSTNLLLVDSSILVYNMEPTNRRFDDIVSARNELAKCIGMKKR